MPTAFLDSYEPLTQQLIADAQQLAARMGARDVEPEHLLRALFLTPELDAMTVAASLGADPLHLAHLEVEPGTIDSAPRRVSLSRRTREVVRAMALHSVHDAGASTATAAIAGLLRVRSSARRMLVDAGASAQILKGRRLRSVS